MKKFEFLSQEDYDPAEESEPFKKVPTEESEPISKKDAVSGKEKKAFVEMQRRIKLNRGEESDSKIVRETQTQILKDLIIEYIEFKNIEFKYGNPDHKSILGNILDYIAEHNETISGLDSKVFNEIYREMKRILKKKKDNYNELIEVRKRIIQEIETAEKE